ncbi:starch phosphorylase [Meinhardsimonia xiamenensis]|uniref:Alpha-1,4 glucan phosphorylase n=1 Tax=Meinhardsimonia xiamenensis TaxID=990712 RepID=A0A1G9F2W1_9RHOB|nr:glycogen/starch/alpha-glucan phosphorylase [Meinhardsimonia xiamenensis]PRX38023.1 starch phosphorylase [Meinhardsimonia xiamenensis]SDK82583.1 starch phosphorylase [Meinhardsimonia xiamenensis]
MTATPPASDRLQRDILRHLKYTQGKDRAHATLYDWRMALSFALRDQVVDPWFTATRRTYDEDRKRVYYLSVEYLIGRLIEDVAINLGLREASRAAIEALGVDWEALVENEPDAALGNGGLGRLAACYMESMATLGVPAMGYGIRYENGLFRQIFRSGQQVETPEDWLQEFHPWEFDRPEAAYEIGFGGNVAEHGGRTVWTPAESVYAVAHDTAIIGWQGRWANTLRLWSARPTTRFDLARFNAGDFAAAQAPEMLARTITRVLYPDDSTWAGKDLRLKQEYFLASASIQDILRRYLSTHEDFRALPEKVAVQINDTHPALAAPELVRLLVDQHGLAFDDAAEIMLGVFGYTNHTLMPEALERWSTWAIGNTLPRHMQIIERLDDWHARRKPARPPSTAIVAHDEVRMGNLAFIASHRVNGVARLHTELMKKTVFADLHALHPERIVNVTNGVTPRRWIAQANPGLAGLITETIGEGWQTDLERLAGLEAHVEDAAFRDAFAAVKRAGKERVAQWLAAEHGLSVDPAAMFDVQVKRIHEYKRQLLNILATIGLWLRMRDDPGRDWVPRVKIFGGKAAPGYHAAKEIIRLINDAAAVINADPATKGRLKVVFPPNYNVSMAEKLMPAADLSEQISTAGMEASGTGNMKLALNGALTIGTLDGANVEIRERVGAENFFLFGLTAEEAEARRRLPDHARLAIEETPELQRVLKAIGDGVFSPGEPHRYHGLLDRLWNHDHFLVASDYAAYVAAQDKVEEAWQDRDRWLRMAALNTARMGYFSSDRSIRDYMRDVWAVEPAI